MPPCMHDRQSLLMHSLGSRRLERVSQLGLGPAFGRPHNLSRSSSLTTSPSWASAPRSGVLTTLSQSPRIGATS